MKINRFKSFCCLFFLPCFFSCLNAQENGVNLNTPDAMESLTLFEAKDSTFLINNCGEVINSWELPFVPSYHTKLLPNGNLLFLNRGDVSISEVDWEGERVAYYPLATGNDNLMLVYEVLKMPNGNYLCAGRRSFDFDYFESKGWKTDFGFPNYADVVVEVDKSLNTIVWEWNIFDHVIQDLVDTIATYGVIKDHPELVNMAAVSTFDWAEQETFMINGIDYNPTLDQIALSVRKMGELMIIDHSTTTEEAKGSTGGNSDKGGDILYRWGNPANYDRATSDQQREFYLQHHTSWITDGEHAGKLSVYNNNLGKIFDPNQDPYSSVYIIDPPIDANGFYEIETDQPFGPVQPTLKIDEPTTGTPFYSQYSSGVSVLPNGNIFITNAIDGNLIECDLLGDVKWKYTIPNYFAFRSQKYPLNYPAFANKDLTPGEQVPGAENNYECGWLNSIGESEIQKQFSILNNLADKTVTIINFQERGVEYVLYSADGKRLLANQHSEVRFELALNDLVPGMYFISLRNLKSKRWETHKIAITY